MTSAWIPPTGTLKTFLQYARNCSIGKFKGVRNCGYARVERLACAVFHVFSHVLECWRRGFHSCANCCFCSCCCFFVFFFCFLFLRFCYFLLLRSEWAWTTEASCNGSTSESGQFDNLLLWKTIHSSVLLLIASLLIHSLIAQWIHTYLWQCYYKIYDQ